MTVSAPEVCALHGIETRLRCASCQTPICLRCQVRTEVGLKCPTCAKGVAIPRERGFRGQPMAIVAAAVGVLLVLGAIVVVARRGSGSDTPPVVQPPPVGKWQQLPDLTSIRGGTTAVVLKDGRVLAVGGGIGAVPLAASELFDPATQHWSSAGNLLQARRGNATVMLQDGRALTAGGIAGAKALTSAEIYDPAAGSWKAAGAMHDARFDLVLTTLADGRVLAAGGTSSDGTKALKSAEVYDPRTDTWTSVVGGMSDPRTGARGVLLKDGRVLVAGGVPGLDASSLALDTAELFDPAGGGLFTHTSSLRQGRQDLTVTLLNDGRVLAAGGSDSNGTLATAEILDPVTGSWTQAGSMLTPRRLHRATMLPSGQVLVTGGEQVLSGTRTSLTNAEIFDPGSSTWKPAASMNCPRSEQAQVTLANGSVLVLGGDSALPGQPPKAQSCTELFSTS